MSDSYEKTSAAEQNDLLITKWRGGDENALGELMSVNMGLVKNIARRFIGRGTEYEDIVQIGTMGMLKAAKSFDSSYGTVFSTYAVPLIIGEIRRYLRDDGIIKVSREIRKRGGDVMRAKEKYMRENGREPKLSELSAICALTPEEIIYSLDAVCPVSSLQESVCGDDGSATLESFMSDDDNEVDKTTDRVALREAIKKLDEQSKRIIVLRFYKELSQQQTAHILGITQVKVSREEKRIFELLRKSL